MSATGRGGKRSNGNEDSDFCPTPEATALACVRALPIQPHHHVIEPSAGEGSFVRALHDVHGVRPVAIDAFGSRYKPFREREMPADVFHEMPWESYMKPGGADWIVGNPPFNRAKVHVEHALFNLDEGGHVAFLLRTGFRATGKRIEWNRRFTPVVVLRLDTRPSFYGSGGDAADYDFIVWRRGPAPPYTLEHNLAWEHPDQLESDLAEIREHFWPVLTGVGGAGLPPHP